MLPRSLPSPLLGNPGVAGPVGNIVGFHGAVFYLDANGTTHRDPDPARFPNRNQFGTTEAFDTNSAELINGLGSPYPFGVPALDTGPNDGGPRYLLSSGAQALIDAQMPWYFEAWVYIGSGAADFFIIRDDVAGENILQLRMQFNNRVRIILRYVGGAGNAYETSATLTDQVIQHLYVGYGGGFGGNCYIGIDGAVETFNTANSPLRAASLLNIENFKLAPRDSLLSDMWLFRGAHLLFGRSKHTGNFTPDTTTVPEFTNDAMDTGTVPTSAVWGSRLSGLVGKTEDATALASVWDETLRTGRVFAPGNSSTKMEFDQTDGVLLPPNNDVRLRCRNDANIFVPSLNLAVKVDLTASARGCLVGADDAGEYAGLWDDGSSSTIVNNGGPTADAVIVGGNSIDLTTATRDQLHQFMADNVFGQGPTVLHIVNLDTAVGGPYWIDLMTYGGSTNYFPVGRVHGWMGYTTNTPAERSAVESWLATFGAHGN